MRILDNKVSEIDTKVFLKMQAEYYSFIDSLLKMEPEQIIMRCYEKVFKEDILMCMEYNSLSDEQLEVLDKMDNPLDTLYNEWLDADETYMEMLEYVIDSYTLDAIAFYKQNEL